jgi:uncharacterized protein
MAKSARQSVFDGLELLPDALTPFVEQRLAAGLSGDWQGKVGSRLRDLRSENGNFSWDQLGLFNAINIFWDDAFRDVLGRAERSLVNELVDVRNKHAHNEKFSYDDAERALDSMRRLMDAISAAEISAELTKMRDIILRTKFTELERAEERRRDRRTEITVETAAGLLPWREVIEPHQDVATGDFQQAEFAADLNKVHNGTAALEYSDPFEFYGRTYLTKGLSDLLKGAAKRLSGAGGDPVVELQTNFGGGKTHSMLALYHMAGDRPSSDLAGLDGLLNEAGLSVPSNVNRAVLVGTARGPSNSANTDGGPEIYTTWGDLAWQLGGQEGYNMVAADDAAGTAPGSELLETLFNKYSPCLILIDEWVAYLRQIYKVDGLPAGTFDNNLTFAQSLTEAVKVCPETLLVASLPASQIEVGGEGGAEALTRLKNTFSRVESSWLPASQQESYEIVRRRLFKDISGDRFQHRDNTLKQFAKLYRENAQDFPLGSGDENYIRELENCYPIHPELFEQLYANWGSIENFQKTRGVLRLMAQIIHELWMANDPSVMIMPGSVSVGSPRIEPELLHYINQSWASIIAGDIDGETSGAYKIDTDNPNLGRVSAARRVARTLFMGTAPLAGTNNPGIDSRRINRGVIQPGERTATFSDALRKLANQSQFMHGDADRYWYSMAASINRIVNDEAAQIEDALIDVEIDKALVGYINGMADRGNFDAVQVAPATSAEVPDELGGVRAVVLGIASPHSNRANTDALGEAKDILLQRGTSPRQYRNMLAFMAADERQLDTLRDAMRKAIAWKKVENRAAELGLTVRDAGLARQKGEEAADTLKTRLRETWCYLIYPTQDKPQEDIEWQSSKIPTQDGLLSRASKKLSSEEALLSEIGPRSLSRHIDQYLWQEKDHLHLKDLWDYLNRYTYLPRLKHQQVLSKAVKSAVSEMLPGPFAFAERWDEDGGTYQGLVIDNGMNAIIVIDSDSVIIKPEIAEQHRPAPEDPDARPRKPGEARPGPGDTKPKPADDSSEALPTQYRGMVMVSPDRPSRDIGKIVEAVIEQLTTIPGAKVEIKLEIDADVPDGIDRAKQRTLIENGNTLGFTDNSVK